MLYCRGKLGVLACCCGFDAYFSALVPIAVVVGRRGSLQCLIETVDNISFDRHVPYRLCSVVWEKLDQIDGNTEYADSDFGHSSRCSLGEHQ